MTLRDEQEAAELRARQAAEDEAAAGAAFADFYSTLAGRPAGHLPTPVESFEAGFRAGHGRGRMELVRDMLAALPQEDRHSAMMDWCDGCGAPAPCSCRDDS